MAEPATQGGATQEEYFALSLTKDVGAAIKQEVLNRYGVPFNAGILPLNPHGSVKVAVGGQADRIFLLGMTDANKPLIWPDKNHSLHQPDIPAYGWSDPRDKATHFFIGEELGRISLNYADGTTQVFPLILGESVWWGQGFYDFPEPFPTDARLRKAFTEALRIYPQTPVKDGNYVAVIKPRPVPLRSITVENSPVKNGSLVIHGITVESSETNVIAGAILLPSNALDPGFAKFVRKKPLRPLGWSEKESLRNLQNLRRALYSSDESFKGPVDIQTPLEYSGPIVSFEGNLNAKVLANVFTYNVQDILAKIDTNGMYHTSTKGSISWGGYRGFGTFRTNVGVYYGVSYTRDMGRSLQEITMLDYTNDAVRCAEYDLRMARLWQTDPYLKYKGTILPPHWGMLVNHPRNPGFENDGHGLTSLFLFKLWQRLPNRDDWLRSHWPDIKAAGDWILWQFDHPEISGATNGVLHTTGESAHGDGYSVYPDCVCMDALRALAQMADVIGATNSAAHWRERADKMQIAIAENYVVTDPKYGRVWSLAHADWPNKSTVLGPLIFQADYQGFAPEDSIPEWRAVNEATYQRLLDTYPPLGFYGQAMGYGQGFVTESALLLDRMHEATLMLDWAAKEIYDPRFGSFIVPEGVQIDPTGRFWFRIGDLGNGVQEGEIVKTLRLVIGVDDTHPDRLQFFPRMPYDWTKMSVEKYPVVFKQSGKMEMAKLNYKLKRSGKTMTLKISADKEIGPVVMRLGPFVNRPKATDIQVNHKHPADSLTEHSGDSWWIRFTTTVGLEKE